MIYVVTRPAALEGRELGLRSTRLKPGYICGTYAEEKPSHLQKAERENPLTYLLGLGASP